MRCKCHNRRDCKPKTLSGSRPTTNTTLVEIYVSCSLETCKRREVHRIAEFTPRGIYEKSKAPEAAVPGVNVPYEMTENPELTIDSESVGPAEAAEIIVQEIKRRFNGT